MSASPIDGERRVLLRFSGELATKARFTRREFERRLQRNVHDALRSEGLAAPVRWTHDRVFVETADPRAAEVLARVFGVQSVTRVERRGFADLPGLVAAALPLFREAVRGRRFAVRARRVGDAAVPFRARELEVALGAALLPFAKRVDLGHPEVTAGVELYAGEALLFTETLAGPAGLPLGVEGRALALVSGGFDSPVAAWLVMKRGVSLDHVFCNLGGRSHELGTLRVMKVIADRWSYGHQPVLHAVDFTGVARELQERTESRYWQVLLKRLMLRAAERIAAERHAVALVTGECLGQVSSQTLQNLAVISEATRLPILRPLVGFNKDEIIAVAGRIGTRELSAVVGEYCDLAGRRPATAAALAPVLTEEAKLDPAALEKGVAERRVFRLRELDPEAIGIPELEVEAIPPGAVVIDLRSAAAFRSWRWPNALHLDFPRALATYRAVARDAKYVLYCEFGLKSAYLAEQMRAAGLDAHHFRGGLRALVRYAQAQGQPGPELP